LALEAAFAMGLAYLAVVAAGEQEGEGCDAAAVNPYLGVAHLPDELDPATFERCDAGSVFDASLADATEIVVVDVRTVGNEELDGRVVDVEANLDVPGLDPGEQEVEHDVTVGSTDVESSAGCPDAEVLDDAPVGSDANEVCFGVSVSHGDTPFAFFG
jgi:hypothetical protein